jgi:hypothetical protein
MGLHLLADLVLLVHVAFVGFVLLGGLLALKWRRVMWVHLPAVTWGAIVEFMGWICPLTPLENWLRERGGASGYQSDFIEQYILPLLYPTGLTQDVQVILGSVVLVVNIAVYGWLWQLRRKGRAC